MILMLLLSPPLMMLMPQESPQLQQTRFLDQLNEVLALTSFLCSYWSDFCRTRHNSPETLLGDTLKFQASTQGDYPISSESLGVWGGGDQGNGIVCSVRERRRAMWRRGSFEFFDKGEGLGEIKVAARDRFGEA